ISDTETLLLYAKWQIINYNISYGNLQGTTHAATTSYNITTGITLSAPSTSRTGYTFGGWKVYSSVENWVKDTVYFEETLEIPAGKFGNVTLNAVWIAISYEIVFDYLYAQGGSEVTTGSVYYDSQYGATLPTPQNRTGFGFDGWYTLDGSISEDWGTKVDGSTVYNVVSPSNHTLYAKWIAGSITVTLVYNNGTGNGSFSTVYINTYGENLTSPLKTGYSFIGWYYDSDGTEGIDISSDTLVTGASSIVSPEHHILYAIYEINSYNITWNDADDLTIDVTSVLYNTLPAHALPSDTAAWHYTGWSPSIVVASEDTVYIAQREVRFYSITFNDADGTLIEVVNIFYGNTPVYGLPSDNAQWHYTGWSPEVVSVTGEATYTAVRNVKSYTITWNDVDNYLLGTTNVEYGSIPVYELPADNAQWHYTGWNPVITSVVGSETYTAVRELVSYEIIFKDSDDTILNSSLYTYGSLPSFDLPLDSVMYHYVSWSPAVIVVVGSATYTTVKELRKYTVQFNDSDNAVIESVLVEYGSVPEHSLPSDTLVWHYTGWNPVITSVNGDAVYTAVRELVKYTVSYVDSEENLLSSVLVGYGLNPELPEKPIKSGYYFVDWYTSNDYSNRVIFTEVTVNGDTKIYALFRQNIAISYSGEQSITRGVGDSYSDLEAYILSKISLTNNVLNLVPTVSSQVVFIDQNGKLILGRFNLVVTIQDFQFYQNNINIELVVKSKPNSSQLDELLVVSEGLSKGNASDKSWDALVEAIENAKSVLASANVSQQEIDNAYLVLLNAKLNLEYSAAPAIVPTEKANIAYIALGIVSILVIIGTASAIIFVLAKPRRH
ncbi:MAG: InlB B-repeat-containing protein, partial [Acholeplasmatales bacterium]|nr:InlB B-repeat-containing protein [Acholeplasmatales bacterium]